MAFSAHGRDTSHFYSPPSNFDEYPWKISKLKAPFNYIRRIERQSIRYTIRIHIIFRVSFKLLSSLQKHHNWYKIIFILENDNCKHLLEKKKNKWIDHDDYYEKKTIRVTKNPDGGGFKEIRAKSSNPINSENKISNTWRDFRISEFPLQLLPLNT